MVNQLNQDPQVNSIAVSGCGMAAMEGSEADAAGDEEVEGQDEGVTAGAALEAGVADLAWDPWDPFLKFDNENSGTTQTLVAASTPVLTPAKENMPSLKGPDLEEPLAEEPQVESPSAEDPKPMLIRELIPDYSDIPLVGFSQLDLHQLVPWI